MKTTQNESGGAGSGNGKYMGKKDVARLFGVTERAIDNWRAGCGMPAHRVGGRVVFIASEVDEWVKGRKGGVNE